jgi:diguanylate cyclase (GGDEF)-like protein
VRGVFVAAKDVGPLVAAQEELAAANRRLEQAMASDRLEAPQPEAAPASAVAGVVDRALLYDRLRQGLARARRSRSALALLSINIERAAGAAQLAGAAERLRACVRATDTLARVGGEAFMALLEGLKDRGDAFQVAEKMLRVVREAGLGASIGIAFPGEEEAQPEALAQRADAALGQAKAAGRDAIRVSS